MNKREFPRYKEEVQIANNALHDSHNPYASTLLGRITTVTTLEEANSIFFDMRNAESNKDITKEEYEALMRLYNFVVVDGNMKYEPPKNVVTAADLFRKRIWSTSNISQVMQFRNCVTDMVMLDFITFEEYVELNNEIDRYIQYTLSNGGMK